ncbi:PTS mannose transporter subunit IIA [Halolactibacillus alkaliphilus]|uniref:PTS mannose transporter subunit IIA n=1 Tax=Halolactibacillus alkaliphilus TaxID=442899 RepID=A0A511WWQ4_9BACI|nr:PTS sugar transporter subunit IIA [Halolactibacillus alkaliphilus]GEN55550.1 PTS mannose transporter subunit IIA [Halolactibacillus alkaliphilus]GGN64072.1 PTS mannose transporter subunit IIA [Halolactibacillus alkaliphilus]SFO61881.1 PTS system, N-acetylgalactosamine-specific IIA component [Halolactibacillus alkaliphilus]
MIGIIITGHGEFSLGLRSSAKMIVGKQIGLEAVPFLEGESSSELQKKLTSKIAEMRDEYEGVIVLADLTGGTPYKESAVIANEYSNVKVIGGTNLSMVLELSMLRMMENDADKLTHQTLTSGKDAIQLFECVKIEDSNSSAEDSEGI